MNGFNFNLEGQQSAVRSTRRQLTPFAIHKVEFGGAEIKEVGKETKYKLISLSFVGEDGQADMSIFWPKPEDTTREVATAKDGHEYERPSRWEQTWAVIRQTLEVVSPKGFEKFKELSSKFRNFDDMAPVFVKLVNTGKGKEVFVKFSGYNNKQGYPQLSFPNIAGVNKEGEGFIADNYIADNEAMIGLSKYEQGKAEEFAKAKPTPMKKDPLMDETPSGNKGSEDIDDIVGDLDL